MFIDTHSHIYVDRFDEDRAELIQKSLDQGIQQIYMPNIDVDSIPQVRACAAKFPNVCIPMMGLHPVSVKDDYRAQLDIIHNELKNYGQYKAIGEIGLDYYWSTDHKTEQTEAFEIQIEWAKEMNLPIVIHTRDSIDDAIDIVKKHKEGLKQCIFHCFTGTESQAKAIIELGFYLGIGGVLTFKNSKLGEALQDIPLESLVLETDAPYLAPHPHRGKRNEPAYIPLIAHKLAEVKNTSVEHVAEVTSAQAKMIFN